MMTQSNIYNVGFIVIIGLFQSCKITKDYARPELQLPETFNLANASDANTVEIPAYNTYFKNAELVELLDSVTKNNPDLLVASENILATQAVMKSVKLNYLPDLNLRVGAGLQRLSKNSMMGSFSENVLYEDYNFATTFSWEIDFWGKLKRQREEALMNYMNQGEIKRAIHVQMIALTATGYYNLLSLDEQLKITQDVERAMAETLEILKVQYSVGEVNSLAIKQSEAQLAELSAMIPEISASIKAQENALQSLAGNYPGIIKRAGNLKEYAFSKALDFGVPADLLTNRPDVRQQELLLQAANARMGIAKTNFYPALQITGDGGLNSITTSNWFSIPSSLFANTAAGLTQPVFNRRSVKSSYEQAVHQREAAVHEFRKSVISAVEEVSTVLSNIDYVHLQLEQVENRKAAMFSAIEDAQVLYKFGDANYLEVLNIQQSYFQTEMAHTATMLKEINAYIALYKSVGGN